MHRPIRTCIGCGKRRFKIELVRIVRTSAGRIAIDPGAKKPGRGAYLCQSGSCARSALKRKSFERKLRVGVDVEFKNELLSFFHAGD
ncbi:MAG TPA: YlxR family protein [bacterium]